MFQISNSIITDDCNNYWRALQIYLFMRIVIISLFIVLTISCSTQEAQKPWTAACLELVGRNVLIGADVDFGIGQTRKRRFSAGLGIWGFGGGYGMYRYLFGQEKQFLELGAGSLFFSCRINVFVWFTVSYDPDYSPFFSLLPLGASFC